MIAFTTEMEILLPTEKEVDYEEKVQSNVEKFLSNFPTNYKESIAITYDARNKKNIVSFKWNDSLYSGSEVGEERAAAAVHKTEYWFKHYKWFRKHNVRNFATSYEIK